MFYHFKLSVNFWRTIFHYDIDISRLSYVIWIRPVGIFANRRMSEPQWAFKKQRKFSRATYWICTVCLFVCLSVTNSICAYSKNNGWGDFNKTSQKRSPWSLVVQIVRTFGCDSLDFSYCPLKSTFSTRGTVL